MESGRMPARMVSRAGARHVPVAPPELRRGLAWGSVISAALFWLPFGVATLIALRR